MSGAPRRREQKSTSGAVRSERPHASYSRELKQALLGEGPWLDEPDRLEWQAYGLSCLARRVFPFGSWCGYVGLPREHPWHGLHYDYCRVRTHHGLTFGRLSIHNDRWWIGFDCGHYTDLIPGLAKIATDAGRPSPFEGTTYRDLRYVEFATSVLACQAAAVPAWQAYVARSASTSAHRRRQGMMTAALARRTLKRRVPFRYQGEVREPVDL